MTDKIIRCDTCQDSHQMWHSGLDRYVPCTRCPVPCRECARDNGRGAYCAVTNCSCSCHHWLGANERTVPPPIPPTRDDLVALLRRWNDLQDEPQLDADEQVLAEHVQWREQYEALADATDRALAAEGRRPIGTPGPAARHVASVEIDLESIRRGGSCRTATCTCGWRGPERSSLELAVDDALIHEQSDFAVQRKDR
jgi:hypothetical protein